MTPQVASKSHWLKALGHARGPLPDAWLADGRGDRLARTSFPRRPRMEPGDRLVLYASGWRCVFALAEVTGAPTDAHPHPANPERWPWSVAIEPLLLVGLLSNAPPVEAIGVPARAMSQQSHIRIGPEHYGRALEAIASVAADLHDGDALPG